MGDISATLNIVDTKVGWLGTNTSRFGKLKNKDHVTLGKVNSKRLLSWHNAALHMHSKSNGLMGSRYNI